jgi:predicted phage-related endonuclease
MIPQDDPRWLPARVGKLTASRMADAIAMIKDGPKLKDGTQKWKPAASRQKLLFDLCAERVVGAGVDHFVTAAMQWGIDNEPAAADAYEALTGNLVSLSGFYDHPTIEWFGASPDREIEHDGLLEIKCPTTTTFIEWRLAGVVPEQHVPQMLAQLACTRRKYVDFVAFDPRVPQATQLFVRQYEPAAELVEEIEAKARAFLAELEMMVDEYLYGKKAA